MSRKMIDGTRARRRRTLIYLAAAIVLLGAALLVGISDNVPGLTLLVLAACALIMTLAHRWQERRRFGWLFLGGIVGFPVLVVLHNLLYAASVSVEGVPILPVILEGIHVVLFLAALLLSPAAILVGLCGWIVRSVHPADRGGGIRPTGAPGTQP